MAVVVTSSTLDGLSSNMYVHGAALLLAYSTILFMAVGKETKILDGWTCS